MQEPQQTQQLHMVIGPLLDLFKIGVGAAIGFLGAYLQHKWERSRDYREIAGAFAGEIGAILEIVKTRRYIEYTERLTQQAEGTHTKATLSIPVTGNYFTVFTSNAGKLGMLNHPLPENIASFYTRAFAILEDLKRPSSFTVDELKSLLQLFVTTRKRGEEVVANLEKVT